ncbi:NAD(P)H-dependent oxidoreductase [Myroides odoratus]|uniref:FMN-dependent NADH-azoreductase n=1 Tax=Myroides odoratus TaxID=256 RepID=UPI00333E6572
MYSEPHKQTRVLVLNASARTTRSQSRKLAETFVNHWEILCFDSPIAYRELGIESVPHINEAWISAAFKPKEQRTEEEVNALAISDKYIEELKQADVIVLATPMYNWSIPSSLKAYIDQVVRVNETWKLNTENRQDPYIGLLEGKQVLLLLTRGSQGYELGGYNENIDFQTNYLKRVFNVIGIQDITVVTIDGEANDPVVYNTNVEMAHQRVVEFIETKFLFNS